MNTNINIRTTNELKANAIPFEISAHPRKTAHIGGWEGKVTMSADFNEPMEEFEAATAETLT
jgi:hypothetical protein